MGKFAVAAIHAIRLIRTGHGNVSNSNAWQTAVNKMFPKSPTQRTKSCPRGAFLGLCEGGLVIGIPAGAGIDRGTSGTYAVEAVRALRKNKALAANGPTTLWRETSGKGKKQNSQMDIVLTLWKDGLIVGSSTHS